MTRRLPFQHWQDMFPFPTEAPPPRSLFLGFVFSLAGSALVIAGILGGGIAGNGLLWSIVQAVFLAGGRAAELPAGGLLLPPALLLIPVGIWLSVYGLSQGVRLRERGRRLRARDARAILKRTKYKPVLLLRSFTDETMIDPRPLDFWQRRYEESLVRVLRGLGPVVAIGRPGDDISFGGAARLFVNDAHWRPSIQFLMSHARTVAIVVGRTEGLWWEIETALQTVPRERLLFFFPYVHAAEKPRTRFAEAKAFVALWNLTRRAFRRMEEERNQRYRNFRQRCAPLIRQPLPEALGDSLFLDFLPGPRARLLRGRHRPLWRYFIPFGGNFLVDFVTPRHRRRLRFDMRHSLAPFLTKMNSTVCSTSNQ